MDRLDKNQTRRAVRGYQEAESFIKNERLEQLKALDSKKSLEIYIDLWRIWQHTKQSTADMKTLDKIKVKHLVDLRKKLKRLASWKKTA